MKKLTSIVLFIALCAFLLTCTSLSDTFESMGLGSDFLGNALAASGASEDQIAMVTTLDKAVQDITPENEYYFGRAIAANIVNSYTVYKGNPALTAYLNEICLTIAVNSPKPDVYKNGYHVAILDTSEINAFATPGGHIFITRGLIACTSSEDELASVIAHEIAHIQLQHGLDGIKKSRKMAALGSIATAAASNRSQLVGAFTESVSESVTDLVNSGYSKSAEYDADATALSLLASAGYQPTAILGMLANLEKNEKAGSGFGKTHPAPADRIANVNKNIGKYTVTDTTSARKSRYIAVKK
jgi:predicted Zn-dependent protease